MDKENEEQEQRKSSVDRVNDLINKAQDVRKNVQRVQRLQKSIQAARTGAQVAQGTASAAEGIAAGAGAVEGAAAGGVGAVGGGSLLAGIIIILLLIILAAIVIIIILGNSSPGNNPQCAGRCPGLGYSCSASESADLNGICNNGGTCCVPKLNLSADCAQYASDPVTGLKAVFNIVPSGGTISDYSTLFKIFCEDSQSTEYKKDLTNGGQTLNIVLNSSDRSPCAGITPNANTIHFGPWTCGAPYSSIKYLVTHESGHIIANRNPRLYQAYPYGQFLTFTDSSCYSGGYIISYPYSGDCSTMVTGISGRNESFAESIALYINYMTYSFPKNLCSQPLKNFPSQCPDTYGWFKSDVFKGYVF